MSAFVYTPVQPHASIQNNVVIVKGYAFVNVSVDAPQPIPAFTLAVALNVNATVWLNGTTLVPTLGWISGATSIAWSNYGTSWGTIVGPLLTDTLQYVVVPIVNQKLATGFAIPSTGKMTLRNPTVAIQSSLLVVASDFTLTL